MRIIIVDDDKPAIESLSDALVNFPDVEIVGMALTGESGLKLVEELEPDVLFLDVEMPDMSGLDFLATMNSGGVDCDVVICTAFDNYMLSAFRQKAFDFLLKPVDSDELEIVMQRLTEKRDRRGARLADGMKKPDEGTFIFYTNSVDFRMVKIKDIGVFQYNHEMRSWEVMVAGCKTPVRLKRNMTNDKILSIDNRFRQVNQKYIINIDYLFEVKDNVCCFYPPFENIGYVKVGSFFRLRFIEQFNKF